MMNDKGFGFRLFLTIFMGLGLLIGTMTTVFAEDSSASANQAVKDVRKGVVQVVVYIDNPDANASDKKIEVQSGTGFLIGSGDSSKIVVTNEHVVQLASDYKASLENALGTTINDDNTHREVIVKGDVAIDAKYVKGSADVDFAILELSQEIGGKVPLTLATDSDMNDIATQQAYAEGFPWVAQYQDFPKFTTDQVNITSGSITQQTTYNGCKMLLHNCDLANGNSGGPLVNSNGVVIGVNRLKFGSSGNNGAIDIREITSILDLLKIDYKSTGNNSSNTSTSTTAGKSTIDKTDLNKAIEDAKSKASDTSKYTQDSLDKLNTAISDAETISKNDAATQDQVDNAKSDLENAVNGLKENSIMSNMAVIGGIIAAVVVVVIIVVVLLLRRRKKNKTDEIESEGDSTALSGVSTGVSLPVGGEGSEGTSVLDDGSGNTTMMGGEGVPYGVLIRKSTNEQIPIGKPTFIIGKERRKVDYCVSDNTSVSRVHAIIQYRDGACYLKDQNATNGTYVNEARVSSGQEVKLKNGDRIRLSNVEFEFKG